MSLAVNYTPEPLFSRRAYKRHMARTAKAFSAISMGAAFVLTSGEAFAQSSRASAENGFSPLDGQPIGFNKQVHPRILVLHLAGTGPAKVTAVGHYVFFVDSCID